MEKATTESHTNTFVCAKV